MKTEQREDLKQLYINLEPEVHPEDRAEEFDALTEDQVFLFSCYYLERKLPTVQQLREDGHTVTVNHSRAVLVHNPEKKRYDKVVRLTRELYKDGWHGRDFLARGGKTDVKVEMKTGEVYEGHAECSPQESWCRPVGLVVALDKAIGHLYSF